MGQTAAWFLLLAIGFLIIDIGITGSLGKIFAVAFAPGLLEQKNGGSAVGTF